VEGPGPPAIGAAVTPSDGAEEVESRDGARSLKRLPPWPARVLAVLVLAAAAVAVDRGVAWRDGSEREDARLAAVRAAEAEVVGLISISAQTSSDDIEALIEGATASFREDLRAQADRLRREVRTNRVKASGEVVSSAIESYKDERVIVIVAARGTVSNKRASKPEPRSYRLRVTVQKEDDRWLVSGLTFVA
jgi:Mce-associated membrane protein